MRHGGFTWGRERLDRGVLTVFSAETGRFVASVAAESAAAAATAGAGYERVL